MATIFSDMAALASAAGSTTCGTASKSSSCASSGVSSSTSTSLSSSLASCESGVILNSSSNCSSLSNSPTASSGAATVNTPSSKAAPTTASPIHSDMLSTSFLAAAASTCSTSSSSSLPASVVCSTLHSSTTAATVATTNSAHQLLLNGLGLNDVDFNAVNSTSLVEDPRALQLALELSMVGLSDTMQMQVHQQQQQQHLQQLQHQHLQHIQEQQQHISHQQQHLHHQQLSQQQQQQSSSGSFEMSTLSAAVAAAAVANNPAASTTSAQLNQFTTALLPGIDDRSKKSQNMTECVPVPSSEHVAEIVGRQGCKIKALRAKTNTYIKTPVRGEEPVFVVTGRKEDVAKAKREILSAAEHFSVIRASRKPSLVGSLSGSLNGAGGGCGKTPPGPPANSGHITIQVRVPYRVVGLVVGSKGATIKHIQQETQTYIVTPSRDRDPIFGVTGLPDNVQAARKQIEAHIAMRTGAAAGEVGTDANVPNAATVHTINSLSQILNDDISPEFLASIYKNGLCSTFDYAENAGTNAVIVSGLPVVAHKNGLNLNMNVAENAVNQSLMHNTLPNMSSCQLPNGGGDFLNGTITASSVDSLNAHVLNSGLNLNISNGGSGNSGILRGAATTCVMNMNSGNSMPAVGSITSNVNGISRSCSSASSTTSSKSTNNSGGSNSSRPELSNIWKNLDSLDVDEGIGESPSIWGLPCVFNNAPNAHYSSSTNSISPTDSLLRESNTFGQLLAIQTQEQQERDAGTASSNTNLNAHKQHQNQHQQLTLQQNQLLGLRRECLICADKEVTAALVPCGHNMFCMECANGICASANSVCPVCSQSVFHAMRILP